MSENIKKTGTTTLGLVCKDGIVLAADKRATAGNLIIHSVEKVYPITNEIAVTIAGSVSDIQVLTKLIKSEIKLNEVRTNRKMIVSEVANLLGGVVFNNIRMPSMIPGVSHFIIGGIDKSGFHLYDVFPDGSIQELKKFVSSGSGSEFAYGVLETMFKPDMSIEEGVKLAVKGVNAAIQRDSCSGNGIDVVVINKDGVKKVLEKELIVKLEY